MNFYRFFTLSAAILLLSGCIGEDYKLWGSGSSGNYSYRDIKNENDGKNLLTVVYANPARLDQDSTETFILRGLTKRYAEDKSKKRVSFTTNPIDATTSTTKLVIQFDLAKNIIPQKLCTAASPLNFRDVGENDPIYLAVVYCKYDKAQAWIRGESLASSKVEGDLIALIAENALQRMTNVGFADEDGKKH